MELDPTARLCFFIDVQGYGARSLSDQERVQSWLIAIVKRAANAAGLHEQQQFTRQELGDGCLVLIHSDVPLPAALRNLVLGLREAVEWTNFPLRPEFHIRVRAAFDFGVIRRGDNGYVGRAIVGAARLVNSAPLRAALNGSHDACAIMVSDTLYRNVILDEMTGFPSAHFSQAAILEKEYESCAWLYAPDATATRFAADELG